MLVKVKHCKLWFTSKIFDGENNNTYVEVGGTGVTQVSGSVTGSLLSNGVMSFFGNGVEKALSVVQVQYSEVITQTHSQELILMD